MPVGVTQRLGADRVQPRHLLVAEHEIGRGQVVGELFRCPLYLGRRETRAKLRSDTQTESWVPGALRLTPPCDPRIISSDCQRSRLCPG
jgi:hypothetical protein